LPRWLAYKVSMEDQPALMQALALGCSPQKGEILELEWLNCRSIPSLKTGWCSPYTSFWLKIGCGLWEQEGGYPLVNSWRVILQLCVCDFAHQWNCMHTTMFRETFKELNMQFRGRPSTSNGLSSIPPYNISVSTHIYEWVPVLTGFIPSFFLVHLRINES
jgi:hypothetical protein